MRIDIPTSMVSQDIEILQEIYSELDEPDGA